jgi:hypothetical protein
MKKENFSLNTQLEEIKKISRDYYDSSTAALCVTFGLDSEDTFHHALTEILAETFGVKVTSITEYDEIGEVFGRPEQIELDLIIINSLLIICEIKSSVSKADIYTFEKKVRFYQERHHKTANRKILISPMVHPRTLEIGEQLGIEVYSYAKDVKLS